ncbi:hypothetical protein LC1Hm_1560 [Halomicrobium sp. LC1Hm]|nr:hypothetical protein LC1Hm_1560 [Halomicrobium sp. LC1Hm]
MSAVTVVGRGESGVVEIAVFSELILGSNALKALDTFGGVCDGYPRSRSDRAAADAAKRVSPFREPGPRKHPLERSSGPGTGTARGLSVQQRPRSLH